MTKPTDKEHWSKWNWGDWFKDEAVAQCRPATRAIWFDALGRMISAGSDRVHGQIGRLAGSLRAFPDEIVQAAIDLAETGTADVLMNNTPILQWRQDRLDRGLSEGEFIANDMATAWLTMICRRRTKELEIKQKRKQAGSAGAAKRWQTPKQADSKTPESCNGKPLVHGSGSWVEGESEGGKKDVAARLEWYGIVYSAFPIEPPRFVDQIVLANCAELIRLGRSLVTMTELAGWVRCGKYTHTPNSPATLSDPVRWDEWVTQMTKDKKGTNGNNTKRGTDRSQGTANEGIHDRFKRPVLGKNPATP